MASVSALTRFVPPILNCKVSHVGDRVLACWIHLAPFPPLLSLFLLLFTSSCWGWNLGLLGWNLSFLFQKSLGLLTFEACVPVPWCRVWLKGPRLEQQGLVVQKIAVVAKNKRAIKKARESSPSARSGQAWNDFSDLCYLMLYYKLGPHSQQILWPNVTGMLFKGSSCPYYRSFM